MSARALMILGTASHVGKSLLTAGLGRIFSDEGIRVAPFKAQNMSLNSAATPDGREIGRAQALQAEACRVAACAEMNPILIKPSSDTASQIVLLGRVWGQVTASDYHQRRVEDLFPAVLESYRTLAARHDLILVEGAGSPAEINLRKHDIVNMRMAHAANAACLLVGDIDRGGVFAALLGTIELLEPEDRARIRGFAINKFRGDVELLRPGVEMMEQRLGIPVRRGGPVSARPGTGRRGRRGDGGPPDSGPCLAGRRKHANVPCAWGWSRFRTWRTSPTSTRSAMEPSVSLAFLEDPGEAGLADVLILPGSKQTLDDLEWLRERGFAERLATYPGSLIGICGGFQMLGLSIEDPSGVESAGYPARCQGWECSRSAPSCATRRRCAARQVEPGSTEHHHSADTRFTWARRSTRTAQNPLPRSCVKANSRQFRTARLRLRDAFGGLTSTESSTTIVSAAGLWIQHARHADLRRPAATYASRRSARRASIAGPIICGNRSI